MINSFTITNSAGESIYIGMRNPEESGFLIGSVDGLGPVNATLNTTDIATGDGAVYNSARLGTRNMVFQIIFIDTGAESIEELRRKAYRYFPVKKPITVTIETDNRTLTTSGYVETNEPTIFSSLEGCQVSVICPDPFFYYGGDDTGDYVSFGIVEPMLEFAYSNESVDAPLTEFGSITDWSTGVVTNSGETDVGAVITLHMLGNASGITVYNNDTSEKMKLDTDKITKITGSALVSGDDIIIDTNRSSKGVHLVRKGVTYNILNCLDKNADWITLAVGDNTLGVTADDGLENISVTVKSKTVYMGV